MENYKLEPLKNNVDEMFIGPFGSSLKNDCFVDEDEAFCMVYEQKHAIQKTMDVDTRYVNEKKYNELKRFNVHGGDIIVSCRGTIGETYIVPDDAPLGIMHPSIMKIRLKEGVYDKRYFNDLLYTRLKKHEAEANGSGVKMAISANKLGEELFPVPSIQQQKEIERKLKLVRKLIDQREEELSALDELIKARFVELFGNEKYEKKQLIELIQEGAGLSYGIVVPGDNVPDGIPMVRPSDYKNGSLNLDNVYRVSSDIECKYKKTRLIGDEILVQVIGQPGQVMLSDERCKGMNVTRNLAVVRIDKDKAERLFISHYLITEEAQRFMFGSTNQSTLKQLPLNKLKELPVPQMPLSEQREFADFIKQVDKSKVAVQKSLEETQKLFDSLMQEYFG